jgi:adenylylsulfate kinase-like enzyme
MDKTMTEKTFIEKQISVTITGPEKSGSTTVGTLLARALAAHNIPCEIDDEEGDYREKFFGDRIHAIQKNPPVVKIKVTSKKDN